MPKYEGTEYRCKYCGEFYHSEDGRDVCEARHEAEE